MWSLICRLDNVSAGWIVIDWFSFLRRSCYSFVAVALVFGNKTIKQEQKTTSRPEESRLIGSSEAQREWNENSGSLNRYSADEDLAVEFMHPIFENGCSVIRLFSPHVHEDLRDLGALSIRQVCPRILLSLGTLAWKRINSRLSNWKIGLKRFRDFCSNALTNIAHCNDIFTSGWFFDCPSFYFMLQL